MSRRSRPKEVENVGKRTGVATGTVVYSAAKRRRMADARKRQEARWAAMASDVEVRHVDPESLRKPGA